MKKNTLLATETVNPRTVRLDRATPLQIARMINREDMFATRAVAKAAPAIARAIEIAAKAHMTGHKIIFTGAGTSGRLGILEAVECVPTFAIKPSQIQGILAGGKKTMFLSHESAEDDAVQGGKELLAKAQKGDFVIALTASGTTPYALGALKAAKKIGCHTALMACNENADTTNADIFIFLPTGPEPLSGSTRMKAGTATKLALNAITTGAMALSGKIYKNLMVNVIPGNKKLRRRAARLIQIVTETDEKTATRLLKTSGNNVKTAIVMHSKKCTRTQAEKLLRKHNGFLREALGEK